MKTEENNEVDEMIPPDFYLSQNYPNPFKERTIIKYCVPYKMKVRLSVYNSVGELIKVLKDELHEAGTYEVEFNVAQESSPVKINTIYYYRLEAGDYRCEKKMELIK